jgi:hypothetical protein
MKMKVSPWNFRFDEEKWEKTKCRAVKETKRK